MQTKEKNYNYNCKEIQCAQAIAHLASGILSLLPNIRFQTRPLKTSELGLGGTSRHGLRLATEQERLSQQRCPVSGTGRRMITSKTVEKTALWPRLLVVKLHLLELGLLWFRDVLDGWRETGRTLVAAALPRIETQTRWTNIETRARWPGIHTGATLVHAHSGAEGSIVDWRARGDILNPISRKPLLRGLRTLTNERRYDSNDSFEMVNASSTGVTGGRFFAVLLSFRFDQKDFFSAGGEGYTKPQISVIFLLRFRASSFLAK